MEYCFQYEAKTDEYSPIQKFPYPNNARVFFVNVHIKNSIKYSYYTIVF